MRKFKKCFARMKFWFLLLGRLNYLVFVCLLDLENGAVAKVEQKI